MDPKEDKVEELFKKIRTLPTEEQKKIILALLKSLERPKE